MLSRVAEDGIEQECSYVGIDISKVWLAVGTCPAGRGCGWATTRRGVAERVQRLSAPPPRAVVLEASGGLEALAASELPAAGLTMAVVNPRRCAICAFAGTAGQDRPPRRAGAGPIRVVGA
jgi:transposase